VGFELVETKDMALEKVDRGGQEWYIPLTPSLNIFSQRFQFTPVGMFMTTFMLKILESIRLAPTGTSKVQTMLQQVSEGGGGGGHYDCGLLILVGGFLCVVVVVVW